MSATIVGSFRVEEMYLAEFIRLHGDNSAGDMERILENKQAEIEVWVPASKVSVLDVVLATMFQPIIEVKIWFAQIDDQRGQ